MMMHGFGFPLFMGGPIVWLIVLIGGYFLVRGLILPQIHSHNTSSREASKEGRGGGFSGNAPQGGIETAVYRLAARRGGRVTVSEVVTEMGIEPRKAEKILESMADGVRVRMEVNDDGLVSYEFPELKG